jgi:hypothetical protein
MSKKQSKKPARVSPGELSIRQDQRSAAISEQQLLYSREQVRRILGGVCTATVVRLEQAGRLRPVRLNPEKPTAQVFYRRDDVVAVAQGNPPPEMQ